MSLAIVVGGVAAKLRSDSEALLETVSIMNDHIGIEWHEAARVASIAMTKKQAADAIDKALRSFEP